MHGPSHKHTTHIYTTMSTSQVRIQLSTRSPDIELPEDTGPILVSTGKCYIKRQAGLRQRDGLMERRNA
jgi:hypothetical protein